MNQIKTSGELAQEYTPSTLTSGNFLTVKQAAHMLGLTERSIYTYLQDGRLVGERREKTTMVSAASVETFTPKTRGRPRTKTPLWRKASKAKTRWLTTITLRQRSGQGEHLKQVLDKIHRKNIHRFPGTVARYLVRNQHDPSEITLVLVWRHDGGTPDEEREAALAAFRAECTEILDWETASVKEGLSLLHA